MSLETYRRKRDFKKTPEPAGDVGPSAPPPEGRRFVVQRHRASRLHYDFRLEIDGVLMSWAVPRGPSLNPDERRMAVHVEDHPISYYDFEGVIPKGEYGGGDVIVWDWGTFEPEETDDPGKSVGKGELKFRLDGQKLRGRFTIVKTRGSKSGPDDWLLIHKRDEDADGDWDVDKLPHSVKTGRTNDEVLAGKDAVWDSERAGRGGQHRPGRRARGSPARFHRADEGDHGRRAVRRSRLALRAEARRLPRRGDRRQRQGPPLDAQQAGRRALLPRSGGRETDLDQGRDGDPRRRGCRPRQGGPADVQPAPGPRRHGAFRAAAVGREQVKEARRRLRRAGRLLRLRPDLPRRADADRRAARAAQAPAAQRAARPRPGALRHPHRSGRQAVLRDRRPTRASRG